jgi:1-acyl-sn-glycerol-3-phosphate acyltransferase
MLSIYIRSAAFNAGFYLVLLVHMVAALPAFFLPRQVLFNLAKSWSHCMIWMLRVFCNIRVEFRGAHRIPKGPLLVASKHQSAFETIGLLPLFREPMFILKRELTWIPLFGLFLLKAQMIPINRGAGARAMSHMTALARERVRGDRQLIIFPEGTRRPVGAEPRYKYGVAQVYVDCGVQCQPVALNSGLFWPRRTFRRYPGTIVVEFLDIIPPGLSRDEFQARAREVIEAATNRLVAEGRRERARLMGDLAPLDQPVVES